jgi:hypothetical protein
VYSTFTDFVKVESPTDVTGSELEYVKQITEYGFRFVESKVPGLVFKQTEYIKVTKTNDTVTVVGNTKGTMKDGDEVVQPFLIQYTKQGENWPVTVFTIGAVDLLSE